MLKTAAAAGLSGTEGYLVNCEVDVGNGLPGISMVGYLASAVREASDRVRTAMRNSGFSTQPQRVTVNLSPADIRKEGCGYDLAIAVAMLAAYGIIDGPKTDAIMAESVFIGELSLGGEVLSIPGVLSLVIAAREGGYRRVFLPKVNAMEGAAIDGIDCCGIESLSQIVGVLTGKEEIPEACVYAEVRENYSDAKDFSDICGQEIIKRATIIAVAGRHNILYIGPAGSGKSMIASRIPGIMPVMTKEERLRVSKLYSICGLLPEGQALLKYRPFRSPHHTISAQAMAGGGTVPKPGEISLATEGVLFLDELAEFKNQTIETLRQPLEEKKVTISRIHSSVDYPADFVLCAATNPCKCGFYPDRTRCRCTQSQVDSYLGRISKPLLDRIDICVETVIPDFGELRRPGSGMRSDEIRMEVERVRRIQQKRLEVYGMLYNSEMDTRQIELFCCLTREDEAFLKKVYEKKGMSARGLHKVLKVARTIADLDGSVNICHAHLAEAISYRNIEDKYWAGSGNDPYRI